MNPKVDFYFTKAKKWQEELQLLREIVDDTGLTEELKWGCPCYTFNKKNIVLIHDFKGYCALLFFKGTLLKDPNGILIQQTENRAYILYFGSAKQSATRESRVEKYSQHILKGKGLDD